MCFSYLFFSLFQIILWKIFYVLMFVQNEKLIFMLFMTNKIDLNLHADNLFTLVNRKMFTLCRFFHYLYGTSCL